LWQESMKDATLRGGSQIAALHMMRRMLGISRDLPPQEEQDTASLPTPWYPYMAPFFIGERLVIHAALRRLVSQGFVVEAPQS